MDMVVSFFVFGVFLVNTPFWELHELHTTSLMVDD